MLGKVNYDEMSELDVVAIRDEIDGLCCYGDSIYNIAPAKQVFKTIKTTRPPGAQTKFIRIKKKGRRR